MDWLKHTKQVSIETSTRCDMHHLHPECPVRFLPKMMMPTKVVRKLISELGENEYTGAISLSRYGEPGLDPRLWSFIEQVDREVPFGAVVITTNGNFLSDTIVFELEAMGVARLHVSLYGSTLEQAKKKKVLDKIAKRLSTMELKAPLPANGRHMHKPLINIYIRKESKNSVGPCMQPLFDISINVRGDVTLCCLDWQSKYVFGNVLERSLESVVIDKEIQTMYSQLSKGDRKLDICKRCGSKRGRPK